MPNEDWSRDRLRAAIAALERAAVERREMEELSGRDQTTIGRWARGERQPKYANVRDLAWGIWRRHPRLRHLARELVEASGYAWADPPAEPEPVPELDDDPELLETWRRLYRDDPGKVRDAARALLEREASGQAAGDGPAPRRHAG